MLVQKEPTTNIVTYDGYRLQRSLVGTKVVCGTMDGLFLLFHLLLLFLLLTPSSSSSSSPLCLFYSDVVLVSRQGQTGSGVAEAAWLYVTGCCLATRMSFGISTIRRSWKSTGVTSDKSFGRVWTREPWRFFWEGAMCLGKSGCASHISNAYEQYSVLVLITNDLLRAVRRGAGEGTGFGWRQRKQASLLRRTVRFIVETERQRRGHPSRK